MASGTHDGWLHTYIVGRYSPAGNIVGQYEDNVQKLKNPTRRLTSLNFKACKINNFFQTGLNK